MCSPLTAGNYYTTNTFLLRSQTCKQLIWPCKNNDISFQGCRQVYGTKGFKLLPTSNIMETVNKKSDLCISRAKVCKQSGQSIKFRSFPADIPYRLQHPVEQVTCVERWFYGRNSSKAISRPQTCRIEREGRRKDNRPKLDWSCNNNVCVQAQTNYKVTGNHKLAYIFDHSIRLSIGVPRGYFPKMARLIMGINNPTQDVNKNRHSTQLLNNINYGF